MSETRTGAALTDRPSGETHATYSAATAANEGLAAQLDQMPVAQAKRLILRLKLRGEISLEQAQAQFARRPELASA